MTRTGVFSRVTRCCLAAAFALSWIVLAGLPAAAAVTRVYVNAPKPEAVLEKATVLEVLVDRTASPQEERVAIETRLFDTEGKPVSKKVLGLVPDKKPLPPREDQPPSSDRLRFTGLIDPYNLAWLPRGGIAPNGKYQVQYREIVTYGDTTREGDWKAYDFWLNAPPPLQGAPAAQVSDPAAKQITVAWQANAAPDLASYTIERKIAGGEWKVARADIKPDKTLVSDTVAKFGTYRYRVVAVRPAGEPPKEEEQPPPVEGEEPTEEPKEGEEGGEKKDPPKFVATVSEPSAPVVLGAPSSPAPRGTNSDPGTGGTDDGGAGTGGSGGSVPQVPSGSSAASSGQPSSQPFNPQTPSVSAPEGFEDTYKGPLDYGVEPNSVTERVPVEIAKGGTGDDTLTVLNRSIDQQRVLPPVAGGLILVVSAAHVLRYLNE